MNLLAIFSLALFVLSPVLAHFNVLSALLAFQIFLFAGVCSFILMLWALSTFFFHHPRPKSIELTIFGFLPAVLMMVLAGNARKYPIINDVSTDLEHPPAFSKVVNSEFPEAFKTIIRENYSDVKPAEFNLPPAKVFEKAKTVISKRPDWEVIASNPQTGAIECVATNFIFNFKDDFVIRVSPNSGGGSRVDMRSRSRQGKGDIGANAKRIREFLASLLDPGI